MCVCVVVVGGVKGGVGEQEHLERWKNCKDLFYLCSKTSITFVPGVKTELQRNRSQLREAGFSFQYTYIYIHIYRL